jgi:CBS domain-containing protein
MRIQAWMKRPVIRVKPHDSARRERIGAIPIVEDGRLVGILTRSDVLDAFVELSQSALPSG